MKKIFLILFISGIIGSASCHWDAQASNREILREIWGRGKLIAGVSADEPPFSFLEGNTTLKGIDIDIGKFFAKEFFGKEDKVTFLPVKVEKMLDLLTSGKVDILLAPLSITEERKKRIDFGVPYFLSGHLILVEQGSKVSTYRDLAGKNVATISGTIGDTIIRELAPTAKRVEFKLNREALQALKDHKVDALVQLDVFAFYAEEKDRNLKVLSFQPIHPSLLAPGFRKGDKEWLDFVNITLLKMMETGDYRKLLEKWFGKVRAELLDAAVRREIQKRQWIGFQS
jgi:ABC-type amino acid transport substrate-binding protein